MQDQTELYGWLLANEDKFEPISFAYGLHFFNKILKPSMLYQNGVSVVPVSYFPYGADMNKDKPRLTFRVDMTHGAGDTEHSPYEATIEFEEYNDFRLRPTNPAQEPAPN